LWSFINYSKYCDGKRRINSDIYPLGKRSRRQRKRQCKMMIECTCGRSCPRASVCIHRIDGFICRLLILTVKCACNAFLYLFPFCPFAITMTSLFIPQQFHHHDHSTFTYCYLCPPSLFTYYTHPPSTMHAHFYLWTRWCSENLSVRPWRTPTRFWRPTPTT